MLQQISRGMASSVAIESRPTNFGSQNMFQAVSIVWPEVQKKPEQLALMVPLAITDGNRIYFLFILFYYYDVMLPHVNSNQDTKFQSLHHLLSTNQLFTKIVF